MIDMETDRARQRKRHVVKIILYIAVVGSVLFVFVTKGVLLLTHYITDAIWRGCDDYNQTTVSDAYNETSDEYIFTIVVYAILSLLRVLEYIILGAQLKLFLFKQETVSLNEIFSASRDRRKNCCSVAAILIITPLYFILGLFVVPGLGIYQEIQHSEHCNQNTHQGIYIAYQCINMLRYGSAFAVRVFIIYCTIVLKRLWFPKGIPQHTSLGLMYRVDTSAEQVALLCAEQDAMAAPRPVSSESGTTANLHITTVKDWQVVSSDWKSCSQDYTKIGSQAQTVHQLFQTWFIVPWVIYLIASFLKTYNILRPWSGTDGDGKAPQLYYLAYNLNQIMTLIIPFVCAKKINTYHTKYVKVMRNKQLLKFKNDPSKLSFARQLVPVAMGQQLPEDYDFVPRIAGTNIEIPIGSLMYVIVLLTGIFLSVSESLLTGKS